MVDQRTDGVASSHSRPPASLGRHLDRRRYRDHLDRMAEQMRRDGTLQEFNARYKRGRAAATAQDLPIVWSTMLIAQALLGDGPFAAVSSSPQRRDREALSMRPF
jgi:hypothetical protein